MIKKYIKLALVLVLVFTLGGTAVALLKGEQQRRAYFDVSEENCPKMHDEIVKQLSVANYCRSDRECRRIYLGCPWDKNPSCSEVYVNKNHSLAFTREVIRRFRSCIAKSPEYEAQLEQCNALSAGEGVFCDAKSEEYALKCVNRTCVLARNLPR